MLVQWNLSVAPSELSSWERSPQSPLAPSALRLRWPNRTSVPATTRSSRRTTAPGPGSHGWMLSNYSDNVAGFATQTSFNLGAAASRSRSAASTPAGAASRSTSTSTGWATTATRAARLITAASQRQRRGQQPLHVQPRGRHDRAEVDCANWATTYTIPGAALPASGVYIAKLTDRRPAIENHDHLHRCATTARTPKAKVLFVAPDGDLPGLQRLGRQVALLRQRRRRQHDRRHRPRGQGLLRPARSTTPRRRQPLHRARLRHGPLAGAAGLRRLLHRRRLASRRTPAQLLNHKIVVISGHGEYWSGSSSTASRPRATPASTSPPSAPTPPTGRSATRTAAARSSVTRPSRAPARPAAARRAPTTGAPTASRAPPTTPSASTAKPARPTTTPRTRPRPSATTGRRPAIPTRRPAAASAPTSRRTQLFGQHVRRRQRRLRLPAARSRPTQRQRRVRRRPDLAQHRDLRPARRTDDRHQPRSAGSGTRSRPRRSTSAASRPASSG